MVEGFHGRPSGTVGADIVQDIENYTLDGEFNSQLLGNDQANVFVGGNGTDLLEGRGGDDQLTGGEGVDTARYARSQDAYVVSAEIDASGAVTSYQVTAKDQSSAGEGTDTLATDIEFLEFAGTLVDIKDAVETRDRDVPLGQHSLAVIANVLGSVMYLDNLIETVSESAHTIEYLGTVFNYAEVDGMITTVIRDGKFTSEFAAEIAESYPDSAGISYGTAVALIGQANMESTLLTVAGADGDYVG